MTVLLRLHQKGILSRHKKSRYFVYSPILDRDAYLRRQIEQVSSCLARNFRDFI